jgi:hypothetical protein
LGAEFDYRAFAPAVFGAREILDLAAEVGFRTGLAVGGKNAGLGGENVISNADLDLRVDAQVLQPVGSGVLGDDVEASFVLGEPDFDFARSAGSSAAGSEIEILIAVDLPSLLA